jgi:hypothetical protein
MEEPYSIYKRGRRWIVAEIVPTPILEGKCEHLNGDVIGVEVGIDSVGPRSKGVSSAKKSDAKPTNGISYEAVWTSHAAETVSAVINIGFYKEGVVWVEEHPGSSPSIKNVAIAYPVFLSKS